MSSSDSTDSDERIRYKTENVRNKTKITDQSRGSPVRSRHRKRNRSPPIKKNNDIHKQKRKKESLSESSSTSSSRERNKRKLVEKKLEDETNFQKIGIHLQNELETLLPNDQKPVIQHEIIGPTLPPHLRKKSENPNCHVTKNNVDTNTNSTLESGNKNIIEELSRSRSLSPSIGPKLPPHMINTKSESCVSTVLQMDLSDNVIGPQLPPQLLKSNELENDGDRMIGPSLPPHLRKNLQGGTENIRSISNMQAEGDSSSLPSYSRELQNDAIKTIGPTLPPHLREKLQEKVEKPDSEINMQTEEEEYAFGPLPPGVSNYSLSHKALEERALQLKIDQLETKGSNEPVRESWMIELPAAKAANFGLGPRQFRNRSGPDLSDRSSWTDLPGDKNKKKSGDKPVDLKAEAELKELRKRDEEQEMLTKKHKRKEKSLLKIHKEKLEKEKKDDKPSERRPFSRDIDLQVNRFDDAQKQAIMKKAQLLDDRFSSGNSKFL